MKQTVDDLVLQLTNKIGDDMVYITASDEERHFDLATLAFSFASLLVLSFLKGFMDSAKKDFEKLGEEAYSKLMAKLKSYIADGPSEDMDRIEEQKRIINEVRNASEVLSQRNTTLFLEKNVAEGKMQVTRLLSTYHFSEIRKGDISKHVEAMIIKYMKEEANEQ